MLSNVINPADVLARIKGKKPEIVQVLAVDIHGCDMIVLRGNGEIRAVVCGGDDDIVRSCETIAMRN